MVPPGHKISLRKDYDPEFTAGFKDKKDARKKLEKNIAELAEYQDILYAQDTYALLLIFQAMDAAGKDGAIKHVMSGVNPQGCQVYSFKSPSAEELDHDYLWRTNKVMPERGRIGIFNRSYYEEVLVVRVHPELLDHQKIPPSARENIWKRRHEQINNMEQYLSENGVVILKFFLNVSKEEQKKRFLERIDRPEKNWKFSTADAKERAFWDSYQQAYEDCLNRTSTEWAPWFVVPADNKWFTRLTVSEIVVRTLKRLNLHYPEVSEERRRELLEIRKLLEDEA
ncbi:polyphosphate kinase 2 family protein [Candidatus Competibacter phosphatis]|nr:polyphosphate kinase 2 family protein [Candidatus Competibacter phosphatis]